MNKSVLRSAIIISLTLCFDFVVHPQDARTKAEESPLSAVFYLLSTPDLDSQTLGKERLAVSYFRAGRYAEVKNVAALLKPNDGSETFAGLADQMLRDGVVDEGSRLVQLLTERFKGDEYRLLMLLRPLVRMGETEKAEHLFDGFDDSDKIDAGFELAKIYLEFGRPLDAFEIIERISPLVELSKYDEEKADIAQWYAKLGDAELALKWMRASRANLAWKSGKPEYSEGRILDRSVDTLRTLGRNAEADDLLRQQGNQPETESQTEIALRLLRSGKAIEARALLEKLRGNKATSTDVESRRILIDVYISLNEPDKAATLLRMADDNTYAQQARFISTADLFAKRKENAKARSLLDLALHQTAAMDLSEPEDGRLSSSAKSEQARYQSIIALRYGSLHADDEALRTIRKLKKPYLKARTLTEYVLANKRRLPVAQQRKFLEEAVYIVHKSVREIFDANKFDVYGFTALAFAEIGLKSRSSEVFAQALLDLDKYILEEEVDSTLIDYLNDIGVKFERAKIEPSDDVRKALRQIINNWEGDKY